MKWWGLGWLVLGVLACSGVGSLGDGSDKAKALCEYDTTGAFCRTVASSTTTFRIDDTEIEILEMKMFDASLDGNEVVPPREEDVFEAFGGQGFVVLVAYTNASDVEARLYVTMGCVDVDGAESGSWFKDAVYFTKGEPGWPNLAEPILLPAGGTVKIPYVIPMGKDTAVGGLLFFDGAYQPDLRGPDGKDPRPRVVLEIPDF